MSHSDAFSRLMERDPVMRSTVVMVAALDGTPSWDRFTDRVRRATEQIPLMRARVEPSPLAWRPDTWVPVDDLDLGWHVNRMRLPAPGSWDQVMAVGARAASTVLDPARPLWHITLVEGVKGADGEGEEGEGEGEGSAAVLTFHHSITDGIGGVRLAVHLFDLEADPIVVQQPLAHDLPDHSAGIAPLRERLATRARSLGATPLASVAGTARTLASAYRVVAPFRTTLSPVMTERTLGRSFHALDVPLDGLRRAAKAADAKLNDAFLAGITGGLRRYHDHHAAEVDRLRVTLPVSLRVDSDPLGGNRITLVRFKVGTAETDPVARMRATAADTVRLRAEPALPHTQRIAAGLNLLPTAFIGGMLKHVDFLASNVPGFPVPVHMAGAPMSGLYPFGPTAGASMNITLMSYDQTCCLGISCDSGAIPDSAVMAACLADGFTEVLAVAGEHEPVTVPGA